MGQSRKKKSKSSRRSGATGSRNPLVTSVPAPKDQLRPLFAIFGDMTSTADRLILETPEASSNLARFDVAILVRGINSLKSIRLLLENGHWEHAVGITRQLFELLVNMEYLGSLEDRLDATFQYVRFGALQMMLERHREIAYSERTNRPVDEEKRAFFQYHFDNSFDDFKGRPKDDGSVRWVPSWSKKNTKALAELSSNKMRIHQYENLFTLWSEQAHATPGSLIHDILRVADGDWVDELVQSDERKIVEASSMAIMLFVELWMQLPHVAPPPAADVRDWARRMMEIVGAPEFDSLPGYRSGD